MSLVKLNNVKKYYHNDSNMVRAADDVSPGKK